MDSWHHGCKLSLFIWICRHICKTNPMISHSEQLLGCNDVSRRKQFILKLQSDQKGMESASFFLYVQEQHSTWILGCCFSLDINSWQQSEITPLILEPFYQNFSCHGGHLKFLLYLHLLQPPPRHFKWLGILSCAPFVFQTHHKP